MISKNDLYKSYREQRGPPNGTNDFDFELYFEGHLKIKALPDSKIGDKKWGFPLNKNWPSNDLENQVGTIRWPPLFPLTFVEVIFYIICYYRGYPRGRIKMKHPVYKCVI